MLVNKTVEFFLSEAAGRTGDLRGPRLGSGQDAGEDRGLGRDKMPAEAGSGLGQDAGGGRGRDWDEIPAGNAHVR